MNSIQNQGARVAQAIRSRDQVALAQHSAPTAQGVSLGGQAAEEFNEFFESLKTIFPAWRHAFPTQGELDRARKTWAKAFIENGLTEKNQLMVGLRVARAQEVPFFPSPGQFMGWCKPTPEQFGLPSMEQAYREAISGRSSHPAVALARQETRWERQSLRECEYRKVFERAYTIAVRRVMNGEQLDLDIVRALPKKGEVTMTPERRKQLGTEGIASLRAALTGGRA
jgi:hypothetical protein